MKEQGHASQFIRGSGMTCCTSDLEHFVDLPRCVGGSLCGVDIKQRKRHLSGLDIQFDVSVLYILSKRLAIQKLAN